MGGGWGKWQGFYGLVSDNIRSLNVVLADGTPITVNDTSYSDLFWAMRGAGHNFGVVTSFDLNVYPRLFDTWYQKNYVFRQDKLEPLFEQLNILNGNGTQPKEMGEQSGTYNVDPTNFPNETTIRWQFSYAGSQADAEPLLKPFDDLGAVYTEDFNIPYTEVASAAGSAVGQPLCDEGGITRVVGPAALLVYNLTTQRQIYDLFNKNIFAYPEQLINNSFVVMEAYGLEGVQKIPQESQAYPWRYEHLYM